MRRLVAAVCFLVALQHGEASSIRRLKGHNRKLQTNSVTLTRPPDPKQSQEAKTGSKAPTKQPSTKAPTSKAPTGSTGTKSPVAYAATNDIAYDHWVSPSEDYDSNDAAPKGGGGGGNKQKEEENRPPRPSGTSPDTQPKGGGGGNKGSGGGGNKIKGVSGAAKGSQKGGSSGNKTNNKQSSNTNKYSKDTGGYDSPDGGSYDNFPVGPGNKASGGDYKSAGYNSASYKSGGGNKGGGGYKSGGGNKGGGGYKSGGGGGGKESSYKGGDDKEPDYIRPGGGAGPEAPEVPGYVSAGGTPYTGVPISRFALLYDIDHSLGMPMTADYEQVHENTYLWLYTVMFRAFGDRMRNLITDDTSNIYEANQAITIEYSSVALFEPTDPDIPTRDELDQLVIEAFTGENLDFYVESLQGLPEENPFSSTTSVELEQPPPGEGRSAIGSISSRVATEGMLPPFMAAAAFFVVLAGSAAAWRSSRSGGNRESGGGKHFDTYSRSGDTAVTGLDDDFTTVGPLSEKRSWDLHIQEESLNQPNLAPISEEPMDPDLAPFSDFFDAPNSPTRSTTDEHSQYSIEDFVNEAERNLLGVRIRYPGGQDTASTSSLSAETNRTEELETSTALVPAPPSALIPLSTSTSTAIVPTSARDMVTYTTI